MILIRLLRPWLLMGISAFCFLRTILGLFIAGDFRTLSFWPTFHEAWFANFWSHIASGVKNNAQPRVLALLEGRVRDGQIYDKVVGVPIQGVVLEIGAGSGMWVDVFAKLIESAKSRGSVGPTKIYGVEPNHHSAATLRQRVKKMGLEGIYEVLPMGIEQLHDPATRDKHIEYGSVDCIVTVQCLCSIPEPEENMRMLYGYLKKGGRWFVYEHVQAEEGMLVPTFQRFTDYFWQYMIGGCRLCRPTARMLGELGSWETNDLSQPLDEEKYEMVPHIYGVLTK